ncbi:MAG: hypothetical protein V7K35_10430 [Nostoc sp.]
MINFDAKNWRSHFITIRSAAESNGYHIPVWRREQLPADILPLDAGRSFIILAIDFKLLE